ncbi:Rmf/CrpP fold protein [Streptomyces lunaelactis]|uniref:Rmf/CrpP fold protein n=1 Tax=Streptomyces lunaelactis TaxID=1535768 RepID=UPI001584DBA9|nr:Rmf/CrpP fold protein [Streptomyces lunaelactis]NUK22063.1 hypothetical protein [Streptomyces lunaelactis]
MGTREDIARAMLNGRDAGRTGKRATECPHPRDSLLRTAWIRGYAAARPVSTGRGGAE